MPRLLNKPWIEAWTEYLHGNVESPDNYIWWSAATAIGATLKRHVWVDRVRWKLYPNMYTVLVGRPGLGKGQSINPINGILREANTANIISDRLTIEYVLERLSKGFVSTHVTGTTGVNATNPIPNFNINSRVGAFTGQSTRPVPGSVPNIQPSFTVGKDSSAIMIAEELSVFLRKDVNALPDLNRLWECHDHPFDYGTRGSGLCTIEKPCFSILAGDVPTHICKSISSDAVGGGFTRRVNFVYAKSNSGSIPTPKNGSGNRDALVNDLRHVQSSLRGEYKLEGVVVADFEKYYDDCKVVGEFDDEVTLNYKTSQWCHAMKLALIIAASARDDPWITKADWDEAVSRVDQVVKDLSGIFRGVGESDLMQSSDKVLRFIEDRGYASEKQIMKACYRDVGDDLGRILKVLVDSDLIKEDAQGSTILYKVT